LKLRLGKPAFGGLAVILRDANTGDGEGFTDFAAAVQLRLRVANGLRALIVPERYRTRTSAFGE